jgi:hypothetical protein
MIATGTDVKPLECVFFLRDVRSASYFEQMKGRGARTISNADFQSVTPDADAKTRFVLVDAIGVTEHDYVDACPLERTKAISLKKLLDKAAALTLTEDETATLASRLAKLELQLSPAERIELDDVAGAPLKDLVRSLVTAVDPDAQAAAINAGPGLDGDVDTKAAVQALLDDAIRPLAANPALRQRILELRASHDQVIDEVSLDLLLDARGVVDIDRARSVITSWRSYLEEHRDEVTALQVLYVKPGARRATAEHFLGDGGRWREIWQLNADRVLDDGTVLDSPRPLAAGWTILIPAHQPVGDPRSATHEVTVVPGDTLSGLAVADGITDWEQVWPANADRAEPDGRRFTDPNLIFPGWTITLPNPPRPGGPGPAQDHPHPSPAHGASPAQGLGRGRELPPVTATTRHVRSGEQPQTSSSVAAPDSRSAATGSVPDRDHHERHAAESRNPLPVPLEIGLAAAAAIAVLDRSRRIAQRRRRPGHRIPPPPPQLLQVEAQLRRDARHAQPGVAAVQLAAALSANCPIRCHTVIARDDGTVELLLVDPAGAPNAPAPFVAIENCWRLPAEASRFSFAVDDTIDPYPALLPVGRIADGAVLVNLEQTGPISLAGEPHTVHSYLTGLVAALSAAPWAGQVIVHVPSLIAASVGPLDNIIAEDTPHPPTGAHRRADPNEQPSAGTTPISESPEAAWSTTPRHLYCGWTPVDNIEPLLQLATDPGSGVLVVVNGVHPATAIWTLDADQLTLPDLAQPVTVRLPTEHADRVAELLEHTITAPDVPLGDPSLPDLAAEAPPAPEPTPVQINILGPVEITGIDHPRRSQILNLLTYLALHRRGADHDQIATALWPNQLVAGKTLRNRITEARGLVGGAISDGPRWRLDESVTTDWQRFTALAAGSPAQQHEALELVRGRPFAGLDDVEWIDLEGFRTETEATIVDLAITVAERDLAAGDPTAAFAAARAGLAASRYDERLHRLGVRAAGAEGSIGKVRSLTREMRTVLDLDIEPADQVEPETLALYEKLRTRRSRSCLPISASPSPTPAHTSPTTTRSARPSSKR